MLLLTIAVGLMLAYANGANDNFKGVATLFGSGTTSYSGALLWATVTTLSGSAAALFLARGLLKAFSGAGLVPPEVVGEPRFPLAVALAAGVTVLLATRLGFPVSTTHALIGALVGAGIMSQGTIQWLALWRGFLLPLLASPFIAIAAAVVLYPLLSRLRGRLGVRKESCVCVGAQPLAAASPPGAAVAMTALPVPVLGVGSTHSCRVRYQGRFLGIHARRVLDVAHYLSAGGVSFARGLNDTPKIAALLLVGGIVAPNLAIVAVALTVGVGGMLGARRVAETMSNRITTMNPGQAFLANLITGSLVIGASRLGLPVSTTHVSCGSLFGIGAVTRQARWKTIREILLAWIITLPMAAVIAGLVFASI